LYEVGKMDVSHGISLALGSYGMHSDERLEELSDPQSMSTRAPFDDLPKAELHLHLEGSLKSSTVVELAARHGETVTPEEVASRYSCSDFAGFIQAYIWVTSFLREPEDYAIAMRRLAQSLIRQNIVYAEVILSVGVMHWRKQNVAENFAAIAETAASASNTHTQGVRVAFIFDFIRQFGSKPAMLVARAAAELREAGVVGFGMGGDELSLPASEFRDVFAFAREAGLHSVPHAGEIGDVQSVRDAIHELGAERIGHGIAAMHDAALCEELAERGVALEICPGSNLATGALARQTGNPAATLANHPLKLLFDRGVRVTLSTDDPAMFHTSLGEEYRHAAALGFTPAELLRLAENSFHAAFLPDDEKQSLLRVFRERATALGLL
jgi:adenosine deaminase